MSAAAPTVFYYREGRRLGGPENPAAAGETLEFDEGKDYFLRFAQSPSLADLEALKDAGYEAYTDTTGLLSFGNFVGTATVAGVKVSVRSRKLNEAGLAALLGETTALAAELIYGWRSPTGFAAQREAPAQRRFRYHDLLLLRHALLGVPPGERLQDAVDAAAAHPTRRFVSLHRQVSTWYARELDAASLAAMATHPEWLAPLPPASPLAQHPLTARLTARGKPEARFFPVTVLEPSRQLSFDTYENRFVRTLLAECAETVAYFLEHPALSASLRQDCRMMQAVLDVLTRAAFLDGVGRLRAPAVPTQVLLKQAGYRELFELYRLLSHGPALPPSDAQAKRFIDGKDVATLYEYWVFLRVLRAVRDAVGAVALPLEVHVKEELGVLLAPGTRVTFPGGPTVSYNRRFGRDAATASYSLAFRPDVTIEWKGRRFLLDAKYRLTLGPGEEDLEADEADERSFKRVDLYKMHSYRDALADVESAWVVYPGDIFRFFEATGGYRTGPEELSSLSGVGALPLRPGAAEDLLHHLVAKMLATG